VTSPFSSRPRVTAALALAAALPLVAHAGRERLELRRLGFDLPGPPAAVVPADLDGDDRTDLAVVVAYTEIEEIGTARVENAVEVMTVIPALFDRREVRAYLAAEDGSYRHAATLPLPTSVLHLEAAAGIGVIAMTDAGLSRLRLVSEPAPVQLVLEPLFEDEPALARTNNFYSALSLAHDLDGDGRSDVLFPSVDGPAVWLHDGSGFRRAQTIEYPARKWPLDRWQPIPEVLDVDGDRRPDLVFPALTHPQDPQRIHVQLGNGDGTFRPLRAGAKDCHDSGMDLRLAGVEPGARPWPDDVVAFRDVDRDGRAELIVASQQTRGDGLRKSLKDAKRPIYLYRFHALTEELDVAAEPYYEAAMEGHAVDADGEALPFPLLQFDDLDGDGRDELVTVTLRFSLFGMLKVLATKTIKVGIDFHVYSQGDDGRFRAVPDLDLAEDVKIDLDNLRFGRFAQFAGDFDGDGRNDFVHLGRGSAVTIHRGGPGGTYPRNPDLTIDVDEEPASLDLVRIEDLDGDVRSDLRIVRPRAPGDPDVTAPVRLDLFLSGGVR
jgi:hypothetical protein